MRCNFTCEGVPLDPAGASKEMLKLHWYAADPTLVGKFKIFCGVGAAGTAKKRGVTLLVTLLAGEI